MTDAPTPEQFRALFEPRGVVIAGASTHPGKFGFVSLHNVLAAGYEGRVFATNLEGTPVLGVDTLRSLDEQMERQSFGRAGTEPGETPENLAKPIEGRSTHRRRKVMAPFDVRNSDDAPPLPNGTIASLRPMVASGARPRGSSTVTRPFVVRAETPPTNAGPASRNTAPLLVRTVTGSEASSARASRTAPFDVVRRAAPACAVAAIAPLDVVATTAPRTRSNCRAPLLDWISRSPTWSPTAIAPLLERTANDPRVPFRVTRPLEVWMIPPSIRGSEISNWAPSPSRQPPGNTGSTTIRPVGSDVIETVQARARVSASSSVSPAARNAAFTTI